MGKFTRMPSEQEAPLAVVNSPCPKSLSDGEIHTDAI